MDRRYMEQMQKNARGTPSSAGNMQVKVQKPPPVQPSTARDSFIDERKNHFSFSDKPDKPPVVTKSQSISQFMYSGEPP